MHAVGANARSAYDWNGAPWSVDRNPDRLWSWSDPPFLRWLTGTPPRPVLRYGGELAVDRTYDVVGSIGLLNPDGSYDPIFTATLVAPGVAITSWRCLLSGEAAAIAGTDVRLAFAMGTDPRAPDATVAITAIATMPDDSSGYFTPLGSPAIGYDLALVHLERPIADIRPVRPGRLDDADLGEWFFTVGYSAAAGRDSARTESGAAWLGTKTVRRVMSVSLRALSGLTYQHMYGSFQAFAEYCHWDLEHGGWLSRDPGLGRDGAVDLRRTYDANLLHPGREAYVRGVDQPCEGDQGGPLLRRVDGRWVLYGILQGVGYTRERGCDLGAVYTIFDPAALEFIERECRSGGGASRAVDPDRS
jgi:hypothetical protein